MNRRATAFWVVLAVVLLGIGLLSGRQRREGDPLDPNATNATGTAALLALLGETGTAVDRGLPADGTDTVLLLDDRLTVSQRRTLSRWVGDGGTLVVADPLSPFAPFVDLADGVATADVGPGPCPLPGLDGLDLDGDELRLYPPVVSPPAGPVPVRPGPDGATGFVAAEGCFGVVGDYLQVSRQGQGRVVALGGADPLTNQFLDEADNAVLAVNLLDPEGAGGPVSVLYGPVVSPGTRQLSDLVPSWAAWVAWQLAAAFALFVVWRIRRFGHPVPEPQPVELPASLLVRATGELRRRSGAVPEASDVLRRDLEQRLRRQLKVSPETPTVELAGRAAALAGLDPERVARALSGPAAGTGGELAGLVADIDAVNRALAPGPPREPAGTATAAGTAAPTLAPASGGEHL